MKFSIGFLLLLLIHSLRMSSMDGGAFVKRFQEVDCCTRKLSDQLLKDVGENLLSNYSLTDIVDLGQSIVVKPEEACAERRDEEPYSMPRTIYAGNSIVTISENRKGLRMRCGERVDVSWPCLYPINVLALASSGSKLCVGCGNDGLVESLLFFSITPYRCCFPAMIDHFVCPMVPYSLKWLNDEESITLYGKRSSEYRTLSVKVPDAIFFLKNYECLKAHN